MVSSTSAGPISKQTRMIRWSLFALVLAVITTQSVLAAPIQAVEHQAHGLRRSAGMHHLAVRGESEHEKKKKESEKYEKDKEMYSKMANGGPFGGLGVFSGLPEKPRWGVETGKEKVQENKNKKHSTSKAAKSGPTPSASSGNTFVHESDNKKMDGDISIVLSKILGQPVEGVLKASGGLDVEFTSNSQKYHTLIPTTHITSSSNAQATGKHRGASKAANSTRSSSASPARATQAASGDSSSKDAPSNSSSTDGTTTNGTMTTTSSPHWRHFYRIGLTKGSKPTMITSEDENDGNTPEGARVAAVINANEPGGNLQNQSVITNNPNYGFLEAQDDLYAIRKWAGDLDQLFSKENRNETLMALFSGASRYYPDVDTQTVVRIMMADIKAESDFQAGNASPGRLDSGSSLGLVQVSPYGASNELSQFQKSALVDRNVYSWTAGNGSNVDVQYGGNSVLGPLRDFKTGKVLDLNSLTASDLSRPWINIHVAMWLQANHARTGSQDPYRWPRVSAASKTVRQAYQPALLEILGLSTSAQSNTGSSTNTSSYGNGSADANASANADASANASGNGFSSSTYSSALQALSSRLTGSNPQKKSFATGLGSWVAGPSEDSGGYMTSGDDISAQYFKNIAQGLSVLYTGSTAQSSKYGKSWMDAIELTPGLVDYAR